MQVHSLLEQFPTITMISVSVRLNLESSVTINVSPARKRFTVSPSFRSYLFFLPLTTSVTQQSTTMFLLPANLAISCRWLVSVCLPVLTLK